MIKTSKLTQGAKENPEFLAHSLREMLFLIVIGLLMISCSESRIRPNDGTDPLSADSSLLAGGFTSLDALGRATVKALNDSSGEGLQKLLVTEQEFRDVIFARMPDSLKAAMPWEHAWLMNTTDSRVAIRRKLDDLGARKLRFVRTEVRDTTTVFTGMTLYRNVIVVAEKPEDGTQMEFRFLNVVAAVGGRCKVVVFHK